MTPSDLIDDLRSRINPAYANQISTESYERRLCVEALEALIAENDELRTDADRYRWIRLNAGTGHCDFSFWNRRAQVCELGGQIDVAIDRARGVEAS
jgi:hypothetical protein